MKNLKEILDQANQSIDLNNQLKLTKNPTKIFHKPLGKENSYVMFAYGLQTVFNNIQGKVSLSMNNDPINTNKGVNNNNPKIKNKTQKETFLK